MRISVTKQAILTAENLRELLCYDPETGIFTWRNTRHWRSVEGTQAGGCSHERGYRIIRLNYQAYLAHRLAWLYVYGVWPSQEVDHINGKPDDNSISNLRQCTHQQNCWNGAVREQNGVGERHIYRRGNSYRVKFLSGKKYLYNKQFKNLDQAIAMRDAVSKQLFGDYSPVLR